jgi:hypothetical protein
MAVTPLAVYVIPLTDTELLPLFTTVIVLLVEVESWLKVKLAESMLADMILVALGGSLGITESSSKFLVTTTVDGRGANTPVNPFTATSPLLY